MTERRREVSMTPKTVDLGQAEELLSSDEYKGVFHGRGWITSGNDDGTFLSDVPYELYCRCIAKYYQEHPVGGEGIEGAPDRKYFSIANLFPDEWNESEVEYEIHVRASLITKPQS